MNVKRSAVVAFFCFVFSLFSFAQKNEFALSIGAMHSSDQTATVGGIVCPLGVNCGPANISTNTGVGFEGNYARQLVRFGGASLDVEVPIVGVPGHDVHLSVAQMSVASNISTWTFFLTPSARIKFHAGPIAPFVSVGGGWAHVETNVNVLNIVPVTSGAILGSFPFSSSLDHGVLQFGGGVDFKTPLPHLAVRAEARDFWGTGIARSLAVGTISPEHQHNIFAAGGVVFRF